MSHKVLMFRGEFGEGSWISGVLYSSVDSSLDDLMADSAVRRWDLLQSGL